MFLLCLSASKCIKFCQFSWPYFTVPLAEYKNLCELKSYPNIGMQKCNEYLTNLVFAVPTVSMDSIILIHGLCAWPEIWVGKRRSVTYSMELKLG